MNYSDFYAGALTAIFLIGLGLGLGFLIWKDGRHD